MSAGREQETDHCASLCNVGASAANAGKRDTAEAAISNVLDDFILVRQTQSSVRRSLEPGEMGRLCEHRHVCGGERRVGMRVSKEHIQ